MLGQLEGLITYLQFRSLEMEEFEEARLTNKGCSFQGLALLRSGPRKMGKSAIINEEKNLCVLGLVRLLQ